MSGYHNPVFGHGRLTSSACTCISPASDLIKRGGVIRGIYL